VFFGNAVVLKKTDLTEKEARGKRKLGNLSKGAPPRHETSYAGLWALG